VDNATIKTIEKIKNGDKAAFSILLDKYERPLINYLYRYTGSVHDAEDIAQETFVKVYLAIIEGRYRPDAEISAYIYKIATNLALNCLRRKKIIRFLSLDFSTDDDGSAQLDVSDESQKDPAQVFDEEENAKKLKEAIQKLPQHQRAAIILYYYEEKSYQEIAEILKKSIPSVESLLFRAKQTLSKFFK
jgi:RNA polymerase sigma-70 factor (ECF subfamily)